MGVLWLAFAALCVTAGLLLLWFDHRRRARTPPPQVEQKPVDLFRASTASGDRTPLE